MRNPEIGTFNTRPELGDEDLSQRTFSYEELRELLKEFVGDAYGIARTSKLAVLEDALEEQGADHETFTRFYELISEVKGKY